MSAPVRENIQEKKRLQSSSSSQNAKIKLFPVKSDKGWLQDAGAGVSNPFNPKVLQRFHRSR